MLDANFAAASCFKDTRSLNLQTLEALIEVVCPLGTVVLHRLVGDETLI